MPRVAAINLEWPVGDLEREALAGIGVELTEHRCATAEEVVRAAADAAGMLSALVPLPREVLTRLERLRVISELAVGYDAIDVAAASELGVVVCNVPDYGAIEVADHTLALALALLRRIPQQQRLVASGSWDALALRPIARLAGARWGIVGFGRIGRAVAARARAFGFEVVAHDPFARDDDGTPLLELEELLRGADVISLHAPGGARTSHLIGAPQLALVKPSAVLVNVARGSLVDEAALLHALETGALAGAALDVLAEEPPPAGHPLCAHPNAIVTPHMAFYSEGALLDLRRKGVQNVVDVLSGRDAPYRVNDPLRSGR